MKAKIKHFISQTISFISDMAIAASGLDETIDVKKLVTDFVMCSSLLLFYLQGRLVKVFCNIGLRMAKYKPFLACIVFIPASIAFMLHFTTATILIVFVMMITAIVSVKKETKEDSFAKGSFP